MLERILLAVDGSETATRAVPVAAELAKLADGEVIVFHVREVEAGRAGGIPLERPSDAADLVNGIVHELKESGVKARGEALSAMMGRAAPEILRAATSADAGLILLGSRGLSDIAALLVGSVAHKVIHLADRPVLVVR